MTDLMKIALDRRAELQAEIARMDAFIRMAEALASNADPDAEAPVAAPREVAPGTMRMSPVRRGLALVVV